VDCFSEEPGRGQAILSKKARNKHEELIKKIAVPKDGYIETYLVNETSDDVWFDQFRVLSTGPLIVQETHYDPWGVELSGLGYQYGGIKINPYLYNGKEANGHLGVNIYDFGARLYDPAIGRWFVSDPMAEKMRRHSPYNFAFNNPLRYIDPDGMEPYEVQGAVKMDGYVADDGNGNYVGGSGGRNIKQQTANCTICNKIIASVQKLISSFMSNPSNEEEAIQQQDTRDRVERVSNTVEDLRDAQRSVIDVIPGGGTLNAMVDAKVGSGSGSGIAVAAGLDITLGLIPGGKAAKGGTNLVYQGFDKAGVVKYVGITGRDAAVRFGEHLSSGTAKSLLRYEVVPGATNLSRTGARVWEQSLINQNGLNTLLNVRNSIAPKYWLQNSIKP